PVPSAPGGHLGLKALDTILGAAEHARAVGIGPGISTDDETAALIKALLPALNAPMVVDADALNILARKMDLLHMVKAPCIITPHPGEMGRLCGCSTAEVQAARIERARNLAAAYGIVVVLKGSATVVADAGGDILLNSTGNAGMATAGAGDVLTGAITGLLAQGLNPFEAAGAGVFLHGLAGDLWAAEHGSVGLLAGDLAEKLPEARAALCSGEPQSDGRHCAEVLSRNRA
ncbi:MAG: NAD(P)H-hydrate dehydratase, partial [Chloroflexi bacterium]|nr:NAD(P)H-hydrate dehydratase [Chloroflexota bacterium]